MDTCAYTPYRGKNYWWEKKVFKKADRVVVKSYDKQDKFVESFIIPTNRLPLSGKYETFSCGDTVLTEDPAVGEILDSLAYEKGNAHINADMVTEALKKKGFNAETYVGWFFMPGDKGLAMIHTAWTILQGEKGKSLIDIANTYRYMIDSYLEAKEHETAEGAQDTKDYIEQQTKPLSERMQPMGLPYKEGLYVGSAGSGLEGYVLYQALRQEYPELIKEGEKYMMETIREMIRKGKKPF